MVAMITDGDDRPRPPRESDEAATLVGFLDYQRATLAWKCSGLADEQLRIPLPPSSITLGGLLKHLAAVEDDWFTQMVGGGPTPEPWASADGDDWAWRAAADTGDELRALWAARVGRAQALLSAKLRDAGALRQTYAAWLGPVSLRWIILHVIEEYARHNGQADLIRESIDGHTGE